MKRRDAQTNFIAGEFTSRIAGRSDMRAYKNGAEILSNWALLAQGGVRVRPAFAYLNTFTYKPRLIDFVFNEDQRYVFAFSDTRVDIYGVDGSLLTSITAAGWTTAMLPELEWTLEGDTLILFHEDLQTQKILRTGASTFTLSDYEFEENSAGYPKYQPYYKYADTAVTITPSATTGSITIAASADVFDSSQVGDIIRYEEKEISITGYTDAQNISGTVRETLSGTAASSDWDEQAFSTYRGFPRTGEFHANRLWLGGAKSKPTGVWATKTGAYFNFDLGEALDNEAIWDAIAHKKVKEVRHMISGPHLLIFSDGGVSFVPESDSSPITPKNIDFKFQAPYGANAVKPQEFDDAILYVHTTGATVREAYWTDTAQKYSAEPISLLSSHLIDNPTEMAVLYGSSGRAEQYALLVNGDGKLSVFHSVRNEEVAAWVPWSTNGTFLSICTAGSEVFVAVERELDGNTVWTLEKLSDDLHVGLDCSMKVTSGTETRTFSGFDHLANEEVQVVSNGHYIGTYTVSAGGVITLADLDPELTEIEAGFWNTPKIRPMPCDVDLPDGPARGLMKRLLRVIAQVDKSLSFKISGRTVLIALQGDDYSNPPSTVTGLLEFRLLGHSQEAQFDLEVPTPADVTILGLTREVAISR